MGTHAGQASLFWRRRWAFSWAGSSPHIHLHSLLAHLSPLEHSIRHSQAGDLCSLKMSLGGQTISHFKTFSQAEEGRSKFSSHTHSTSSNLNLQLRLSYFLLFLLFLPLPSLFPLPLFPSSPSPLTWVVAGRKGEWRWVGGRTGSRTERGTGTFPHAWHLLLSFPACFFFSPSSLLKAWHARA